MSIWYECKVKYNKIDENGKEKKVSEPYLLDAISFTEAESRINKEMEPYITGEFTVTNIKVANYSEIQPNEDGDRWFKCKVAFITLDEDKGVEKKTNTYVLVQANDVKEAYEQIEKSFSDTISDFTIPAVTESPILDVFPFFSDQELNPEIPGNLTPIEEVVETAEEVVYDASEDEDEVEDKEEY